MRALDYLTHWTQECRHLDRLEQWKEKMNRETELWTLEKLIYKYPIEAHDAIKKITLDQLTEIPF